MCKKCRHNPIILKYPARTIIDYIKKSGNYSKRQTSNIMVCAICGQEIQCPAEYYPCMYISVALFSIITCASIEAVIKIIKLPIISFGLLLVLSRITFFIVSDIPSAIILTFGRWETLPPYLAESGRRLELLKRAGYARLWKAILSFAVGGVAGALLFW